MRSSVVIDSRDITWASVPSTSHAVAPVLECREGGKIAAGLRREEVESSEEGLESGKAEFKSARSEREPANVDAESDGSEDEALYVFPWVTPAQAPAAASRGGSRLIQLLRKGESWHQRRDRP